MRQTVYLLDASVFVFRAYFALPDSIRDPEGNPTNAVHGYAGALCKLLREVRPTHVAAAFDVSLTSSFRNEIYPDYKSSRALPPEDLHWQIEQCWQLTRAAGVAAFRSKRYEADDLLGTIAKRLRPQGFRFVLATSDKDLVQVLHPGDEFWDVGRDVRLAYKDVSGRFGVAPEQMVDYLALVGDSVDDIPGVPGIGPKTAQWLLGEFGNIANIYAELPRVAASSQRGARGIAARLAAHRRQVQLARRLARIATAPVRVEADRLRYRGPKAKRLRRLFNGLGFGKGVLQRYLALTEPSS